MRKYLLAALAICGLAACNPDRKMVEAVVIDTGNTTADGCGYLLVLQDSAMVKPVHLDASFRHHNLPVKVEYIYSGQLDTCDYGPKVFEMVTISKIKRDL